MAIFPSETLPCLQIEHSFGRLHSLHQALAPQTCQIIAADTSSEALRNHIAAPHYPLDYARVW
jgi:hypothetical protein